MLRSLPPAMSLRSRTTTSKPRSMSSCAALMPATPPPRMTTLDTGGCAPHVRDVDVALQAQLPHHHVSEAEALKRVEPVPAWIGRDVIGRQVHVWHADKDSAGHLLIAVRADVDDAPRPLEHQSAIGHF